MSATPTLEQVEHLVQQLPQEEKETLMQHIKEQLQENPAQLSSQPPTTVPQDYAARIDAFLAAADALAEQITIETDSVETLRQCREERMQRMDPR